MIAQNTDRLLKLALSAVLTSAAVVCVPTVAMARGGAGYCQLALQNFDELEAFRGLAQKLGVNANSLREEAARYAERFATQETRSRLFGNPESITVIPNAEQAIQLVEIRSQSVLSPDQMLSRIDALRAIVGSRSITAVIQVIAEAQSAGISDPVSYARKIESLRTGLQFSPDVQNREGFSATFARGTSWEEATLLDQLRRKHNAEVDSLVRLSNSLISGLNLQSTADLRPLLKTIYSKNLDPDALIGALRSIQLRCEVTTEQGIYRGSPIAMTERPNLAEALELYTYVLKGKASSVEAIQDAFARIARANPNADLDKILRKLAVQFR